AFRRADGVSLYDGVVLRIEGRRQRERAASLAVELEGPVEAFVHRGRHGARAVRCADLLEEGGGLLRRLVGPLREACFVDLIVPLADEPREVVRRGAQRFRRIDVERLAGEAEDAAILRGDVDLHLKRAALALDLEAAVDRRIDLARREAFALAVERPVS